MLYVKLKKKKTTRSEMSMRMKGKQKQCSKVRNSRKIIGEREPIVRCQLAAFPGGETFQL